MKVRILLTALVIFAVTNAFRNRQAEAVMPHLPQDQEATILASTLQIAMFEHAQQAGDAEAGSRGLGTVVAHNGQLLIVTHDHWSRLTPGLHEVELRDASGQLLLTLDAHAFRALIVYRDGGTMVLQAPETPGGLIPAKPSALGGGWDRVWFARRAAGSGDATVEVVAATVSGVEGAAAPARMHLRTADGSALLPGDSGGGVWSNGQLLGNVWAAGIQRTRYFWSEWLGGAATEPSNLVIAALHPLAGLLPSCTAAPDAIQNCPADTAAVQDPDVTTREDKLQTTLLAE